MDQHTHQPVNQVVNNPAITDTKGPIKHEPDAKVALLVTQMNPLTPTASQVLSSLAIFTPPKQSPDPSFGPYKYITTGNTYKGQYNQGLRNGFGEQSTVTGLGYIGEWKNDVYNGKGRLVFENGDLYEGDFVNGEAHGKGKFFNKGTGSAYEGDFKNNHECGKGRELYRDGSYYEGDFAGDRKTGRGVFVFADGSKYTGEYLNDEIEGQGKPN